MPDRQRIVLEVALYLDPIPGAFHTKESAQEHIQAVLLNTIPHYDPIVLAK